MADLLLKSSFMSEIYGIHIPRHVPRGLLISADKSRHYHLTQGNSNVWRKLIGQGRDGLFGAQITWVHFLSLPTSPPWLPQFTPFRILSSLLRASGWWTCLLLLSGVSVGNFLTTDGGSWAVWVGFTDFCLPLSSFSLTCALHCIHLVYTNVCASVSVWVCTSHSRRVSPLPPRGPRH